MSTPNSTSEYLLLFRGNDWSRSLSPAELQQTMSCFMAWLEHLSAAGIVQTRQPLLVVEVRPVAAECPTVQRARLRPAENLAPAGV